MTQTPDNNIKELTIDCKNCFGLCCTALYFSASDGFPESKTAGKPCVNLQEDFTCRVHKKLKAKGLKGCTAYDCFGAGQKVAQITYKGQSWLENKESSKEMFEVFLVIRQLHEMMWYLTEALMLQADDNIKREINSLLKSNKELTLLNSEALLKLDIESLRNKVNPLLKKTSEMIRAKIRSERNISSRNGKGKAKRFDYFGADLRKTNLIGADLRGTLLIAANLRETDLSGADFIGADMRDADLSGADLSKSIFLTQAQINSAKGNSHTKLPYMITRPGNWENK